ncbi:MAG: NAD(P)-binding domain-containing protein [Tabrizicola sp.]|nr:NAD(P)-binding domain-containing protein [Tabrizicola sp.]
MMKIGILGAGHMSKALGCRWIELGHEVMISGRTASKASQLAASLGDKAQAGSFREAVAFGDTVLLAVRYEGVLKTLLEAGGSGGAFIGKTIIDCNNAVETDAFTMAVPGAWSLAELIASTAAGASVVKAFHLCQASVWTMAPPRFDGRALTVPICGNEHAAKSGVADLIHQMGCQALDLGPLIQARNLEPMAAVIIKLLFSGAHPSTNFNLVDAVSPGTRE